MNSEIANSKLYQLFTSEEDTNLESDDPKIMSVIKKLFVILKAYKSNSISESSKRILSDGKFISSIFKCEPDIERLKTLISIENLVKNNTPPTFEDLLSVDYFTKQDLIKYLDNEYDHCLPLQEQDEEDVDEDSLPLFIGNKMKDIGFVFSFIDNDNLYIVKNGDTFLLQTDVKFVKFSSNSMFIAVVDFESNIKIYNVNNLKIVKEINSYMLNGVVMGFTHDLINVITYKTMVNVYEKDKDIISTFSMLDNSITNIINSKLKILAIKISQKSKIMALIFEKSNESSYVQLFNISSLVIDSLGTFNDYLKIPSLSYDETEFLYINNLDEIVIYNISSKERKEIPIEYDVDYIIDIKFSKHNHIIFIIMKRKIIVYNIDTLEIITELECLNINKVNLSEDGNFLFVGNNHKSICIYNLSEITKGIVTLEENIVCQSFQHTKFFAFNKNVVENEIS